MDQSREGTLLHFLGDDSGGIILGIAGVDDDWQAGLARDRNVGAEQCPLHRAIGVVVMIIESGFTDRDNPGMFGCGDQHRLAEIGMSIGFMRVNADAGPDIRLSRRSGNDLLPLALAGRNVEKTPHPGRTRARQHPGLILDQPLIFQVAVRIDQHRASSDGISRRGNTPTG